MASLVHFNFRPYWTLQVIGAEPGKPTVLPLHNHLYSQRSPEFRNGCAETVISFRPFWRSPRTVRCSIWNRSLRRKETRPGACGSSSVIALPGYQDPLYLVVARGFGEEPLMLLTNVALKRARRSLWWAVESYMTRWTIEETIRFIRRRPTSRWPISA